MKIPVIEFLPLNWIYRSISINTVAILPTKHRLLPVTRYSTTVLLIQVTFVRAHVDEIDWRFNGHSFTKSGRGQAKIFATLCAPNNTNPPFQNPGSATAMHIQLAGDNLTSQALNMLLLEELAIKW